MESEDLKKIRNTQRQLNIYVLTSAGTHPLKAQYQVNDKIPSWIVKPATPAQRTVERFAFGRQVRVNENLKYFYSYPH